MDGYQKGKEKGGDSEGREYMEGDMRMVMSKREMGTRDGVDIRVKEIKNRAEKGEARVEGIEKSK